MKLVMSVVVVICVILLLVTKIDCRTKTSTPSIHSSRVVSTAKVLTSSCAVIEEGVPVCQDPEEDNKFATRTPYLQDNWFDYGARDFDRKPATEGGSRPLGWWWRFISVLKRNLEKKSSPTTTAVLSDASQIPETIVTYSIKGCSPTIVPFDLSPCSNLSPDVPQPVSTTRVIYYVPPTSRIDTYNPSDFDQ
ncbi:PREDICTED: uncharacterized protein LOC107169207 [Diuraphis noxia]|uniref:uncharacterized protein LOC107169207 n=1 Tax=Diuraphis noxia TaxID=143948 RepID=UPI0007636395|nr:PREDICTED: uncharacterized protein LOC107169207 [Diuraphis noxia]